MKKYNYDGFSAKDYDLTTFSGPPVGTRAPDFKVYKPDGTATRLLQLDSNFLVLELGSITCPLFQTRREGMSRLVRDYPNLRFTILYVREAHPGADVPAHRTLKDKLASADLLRSADREGRDIRIDDIDGTAHQAYGGYPNAVFIINRNGCVVFASDWNNPKTTARALKALTTGNPAPFKSYFKPALPHVAWRTFRRGGKGAAADFFKALPNLIWANLIRRNLLLFLGHKTPVAPDTRC
jgi:iodothyronine deiodinase-like protein